MLSPQLLLGPTPSLYLLQAPPLHIILLVLQSLPVCYIIFTGWAHFTFVEAFDTEGAMCAGNKAIGKMSWILIPFL